MNKDTLGRVNKEDTGHTGYIGMLEASLKQSIGQISMNKKSRWALFSVTMFLVYILLSTFNLLLSSYSHQGNRMVSVIGRLTDGTFDFVWTLGWLLGFMLGTSLGDNGIFIGETITFLIGARIILGLFNISFKDLADGLDNIIKKGP